MKNCLNLYAAKYPKAMMRLEKYQEALRVFYDFPAEHWGHLRSSNSIESVFATMRLRTTRSKNCGRRSMTLEVLLTLMETDQKQWYR
jgi:putative transposase